MIFIHLHTKFLLFIDFEIPITNAFRLFLMNMYIVFINLMIRREIKIKKLNFFMVDQIIFK